MLKRANHIYMPRASMPTIYSERSVRIFRSTGPCRLLFDERRHRDVRPFYADEGRNNGPRVLSLEERGVGWVLPGVQSATGGGQSRAAGARRDRAPVTNR